MPGTSAQPQLSPREEEGLCLAPPPCKRQPPKHAPVPAWWLTDTTSLERPTFASPFVMNPSAKKRKISRNALIAFDCAEMRK